MRAAIIIPVYNGMAYIAETLKSAIAQSQRSLEIIVVDDFSTDSTVEIVNFYGDKDKRVRLIKHESNRGRSIARNTGIASSSAEIILCNDHDDILLSSRVGATLAFFKKNPSVDVTYSKFQVIDALGEVLGLQPIQPFDFERVKKTGFTYIGHSTMAFRRKVFDAVKYTDGEYSRNAIDDWKFQVDAYKAGFRFCPINKTLEQYRLIQKPRDEKRIAELKEAAINA